MITNTFDLREFTTAYTSVQDMRDNGGRDSAITAEKAQNCSFVLLWFTYVLLELIHDQRHKKNISLARRA